MINSKNESSLIINNKNEVNNYRTRGATSQVIDSIALCLPAKFDLNSDNLIKYFHFLTNNLNSSNAKYISDAMLNISRKVNDDIFFKYYLEFTSHEKFSTLGKLINISKIYTKNI